MYYPTEAGRQMRWHVVQKGGIILFESDRETCEELQRSLGDRCSIPPEGGRKKNFHLIATPGGCIRR